MSEAIMAYRHVAASPEFREIERVRSKARHDEAQAIYNAERRGEIRGEERANANLQGIIADKEARIAELEAMLGARKLANKDAENAELRAQLAQLQAQIKKQ